MGKYIKKFDTHSDYEDFIETEDFILPNVSYCVDNVEVHYNPIFWAYEYEPGRFIAGEILNGTLYLYAPTGSGNKWVFDANGVVLENISYSPYLQDTIDAINERFGTSFRDEDDKDSDFTTGGTVPNWNAYEKIEIPIIKVYIVNPGIFGFAKASSINIATKQGKCFIVLKDTGVISGIGPEFNDGLKSYVIQKMSDAGYEISSAVSYEPPLDIGDSVPNWSEYVVIN